MIHKPRAILTTLATVFGIGTAVNAETLQFAHFLPEQFPPNKSEMAFAAAFEAATGGDISVDIAFGGTLGGQKEMLDFVGANVVSMASFPGNHYVAELPGNEAFGMSLTYATADDTATLFKRALQTLPKLQDSFTKQNVTPFLTRGLDPYVLLCNKPVRKVADLKGLKIRTFGSAVPAVFEGLGAVPINLLTSDTYEAMQRGTVDCAYFSRVAHLVFKLHEVSKYYIDFEFGSVVSYSSYVNNDVYNSWTDDQRAAFWVASEKGEAVADQVLNAMLSKAKEVFENNLETMTIEDGQTIWDTYDAAWMLKHYVETVSALGPYQADVAEEVAAFLTKELGL